MKSVFSHEMDGKQSHATFYFAAKTSTALKRVKGMWILALPGTVAGIAGVQLHAAVPYHSCKSSLKKSPKLVASFSCLCRTESLAFTQHLVPQAFA